MTLLMYAARCADPEIFAQSKLPVETHLGSDEGSLQWEARDRDGKTVLHHAAEAGSDDVLNQVMAVVSDKYAGHQRRPPVKVVGYCTAPTCVLAGVVIYSFLRSFTVYI